MVRLIARRLADAFFLTRPVVLVPVWGFCVFGASRFDGLSSPRSDWCWGVLGLAGWGVVIAFSCAVAAVYVLNQIADIDADRRNSGFAPLAHGGIAVGDAWWMASCTAFLPLVYGVLRSDWLLCILAILALLLGLVYSVRPCRLSGRPVLDFLSNAIGFGGLAFVAGWHAAGGTLGAEAIIATIPYVLLMGAGSISSTIPDIPGDRADAKRTTAVVIGEAPSQAIAAALLIVAGFTAVALQDMVAVVCAAGSVPAYAWYFVRRSRRSMEATYKVGGAWTMVVAAWHEPLLAATGIAVVVLTVVYFRLRFGIVYPSLLPARHVRS